MAQLFSLGHIRAPNYERVQIRQTTDMASDDLCVHRYGDSCLFLLSESAHIESDVEGCVLDLHDTKDAA